MKTTLTSEILDPILAPLARANAARDALFPGEPAARQPVHTVYGGAHLFKTETAATLGKLALQLMREYAPDADALAQAVGFTGDKRLARTVYDRTLAKLEREPVEDYRIDFEDGYGNRPDTEEDTHAVSTAEAVARGAGKPGFPPFIGIRIKPLTEVLKARAIRTLDLFVTTLVEKTGVVPENFAVTLPKVTVPDQVTALVRLLEALESKHGLRPGALRLELMIETPQSIFDSSGTSAIPKLLAAAEGRCRGLHFGVYDYTANCNVTAEFQSMLHPACDFARHVLQVCAAGRGVTLSDGATNIMPVPRHRAAALTAQQAEENRAAVRSAMRLHFEQVQRSLAHAYYQGWDLHPGQLPTRFAAVYAFFWQSFDAAAVRLRNFVEKAAQATLVGDVFDDAATGQGLLNFFLRGVNCGAFTEEEACSAGVTVEELRGRSFLKILENRRKRS
ncbi:MAG: phosphoenolpyruvate kinase [Acidobacteriia bacterium]|nr:phosphoenolpyruvate kinase [Terriglobia bacterium]